MDRNDIDRLEAQLNDFDPDMRARAMDALANAAARGGVRLPAPGQAVNLHLHTFFSYNALGYSPSRLAWEARKLGLRMAGIVDFDVLDGRDEFYAAGDRLDLPASVGLETRVFVPDFADEELSSPGEPDIAYFMGVGFVRDPQTDAGRATLASMADRAQARNRAMLEKVNAHLDAVRIDYDRDVLPLAPAGRPTERHMLQALEAASRAYFADRADEEAAYWADKLGLDRDEARALLEDSTSFRAALRAKLMKKGGVAYAPPDRDTFPDVGDVVDMVRSARAIPTITWLDGTRAGEADPQRFVDAFLAHGCEALNIIPDRNWRLSDPEEKRVKTANLYAIAEACRGRDLPIIVGTEMNKAGQPSVDAFDAPELAPVAEDFYAGAAFLYGHTLLARALGHGRMSAWAGAHFPDRRAAVDYYADVGRKAGAPAAALGALKRLAADHPPEAARRALA